MIQIEHLYKTYAGPVHALRDICFQIEKGEFVFLTGPSGAGKTTLFRMLSAYDKPTTGKIEIAGHDLTQISEKELYQFRRRIGVVFQDYRLLRDRSVFENIALPLIIRNEKPKVIKKKVMELIEQVGLLEREDHLPDMLSGGEQQRAAIARAIIHQPSLLIADEPTGNLDPKMAEEIMDLFEKVSAQGSTVVIASHDLAMVERRKKRVFRLDRGQLLDDRKIELGGDF